MKNVRDGDDGDDDVKTAHVCVPSLLEFVRVEWMDDSVRDLDDVNLELTSNLY